MRTYICNSCGAEIIVNDETTFTTCLYCGNNIAITQKEFADLNIKKIIPFEFDKEDIIKKYKHAFGKIIDAKKVYIPVRYCSYDFDYLLYYEYVVRGSGENDHDQYYDTQDLFDGRVENEIVFGNSKVCDGYKINKISERERLDFDPVLLKDVSIENTTFDSTKDIRIRLEENVRNYSGNQIRREITKIYSENYFVSDINLEDFSTLIPIYILKMNDGRIINVPGVNIGDDKNIFSLSPGIIKYLFIFLLIMIIPMFRIWLINEEVSLNLGPQFYIVWGAIAAVIVFAFTRKNLHLKRNYDNFNSNKYSYSGNRKKMKY